MENNIRKALAGKTIEKDFDPSIGCSSRKTIKEEKTKIIALHNI